MKKVWPSVDGKPGLVVAILVLFLAGALLLIVPKPESAYGKLIKAINIHYPPNLASFSYDGEVLGTVDGTTISTHDNIRLWAVGDGRQIRTLSGRGVYCINFSPDGKIVATGTADGVRLWKVADGLALPALDGDAKQVFAIAYGNNGQVLAAGGGARLIQLWDIIGAVAVSNLTVDTWVTSLAFSPDGQMVSGGLF